MATARLQLVVFVVGLDMLCAASKRTFSVFLLLL